MAAFDQDTAIVIEQTRLHIERLRKCIDDLGALDPQKIEARGPEVIALEARIKDALAAAFGEGSASYVRYRPAASLTHGKDSIGVLLSAIRDLEKIISDQEKLAEPLRRELRR
jgi:hypothetical protein